MAKFIRRSNLLHLDFGEVQYNVNTLDSKFIGRMNEFAKAAKEMSEMEDSEETSAKCAEMLTNTIECVLEKGAVKKILGEEYTTYDLMDVISYILDELNDFKAEKQSRYDVARIVR